MKWSRVLTKLDQAALDAIKLVIEERSKTLATPEGYDSYQQARTAWSLLAGEGWAPS